MAACHHEALRRYYLLKPIKMPWLGSSHISASLGLLPLGSVSASAGITPGYDSEVLSGSGPVGRPSGCFLEYVCPVHYQLHLPGYIGGYVYPEPYRCTELTSSI